MVASFGAQPLLDHVLLAAAPGESAEDVLDVPLTIGKSGGDPGE
jgi:hypothetical protein